MITNDIETFYKNMEIHDKRKIAKLEKEIEELKEQLENDTEYEIQINFEKRPICFRKTRTKEIFNSSRPDDISIEELQAINKQVEELRWNK